jgi:hypothetical protein
MPLCSMICFSCESWLSGVLDVSRRLRRCWHQLAICRCWWIWWEDACRGATHIPQVSTSQSASHHTPHNTLMLQNSSEGTRQVSTHDTCLCSAGTRTAHNTPPLAWCNASAAGSVTGCSPAKLQAQLFEKMERPVAVPGWRDRYHLCCCVQALCHCMYSSS